jgi:homoserine kinase type II
MALHAAFSFQCSAFSLLQARLTAVLSTNDVVRVLGFYTLGKLQRISQPRAGAVNETVFVQTTEGRYTLRRISRRQSEADQHYRQRLMAWLSECGVEVPQLQVATTGDTLLSLNGRLYEVMTFVEGEEFEAHNLNQIGSVGAMLAQYHGIVQHFPDRPTASDPRYTPQSLLGLTERLLERDMMGELYDQLSQYDRRAIALRQTFPSATYKQLPHLVIHGDMHADNIIFAGDMVAALIDFDQVAWDARIMDLADALVSFASTPGPQNWMVWGVFRGPLDEEKAVRLVTGYMQVQALSDVELRLLPVVVEISWLQAELKRVLSTPEGDPNYHQEVLAQGLWLSAWMNQHGPRLLERWLHEEEEEADQRERLAKQQKNGAKKGVAPEKRP